MSINKIILAFSFLVPVVVASAAAQAGATISDKRYLPNEAKETTPAVATQRNPMSAFGYDQEAARLQPMNVPDTAGTRWRYHGGPKSQ
ncbi:MULTISPECIES: hypothetical protein [Bradyrhizobium]|jgi:hypothetical protein|uniref:hypothetical protein n=1 Tax=Bradyrhizobium TaxID=374 RepID=UPI00048376E0|nr:MULTISPECIES: hypothetical protein [Bradyrhizobium]MCS3450530.1 hypothetical protein [Bradyrhizobium elkanii]MCS3558325.1 hypothetical protein [Bradyrhizobium elkanii]MCW2151828.1 hypothetical protein [Bradyrhizobium elkanii]MCW2358299.1 hypothetical protein [Bradyrhizobium elkanii]MCW2375559.1 hypothetical protein [Bradyrhizobium elkanii]